LLHYLQINCQLQIKFAYYNYISIIRAIPEHLVNFYSKNITTCSGVAPTFFAPPFVATNARKQNLKVCRSPLFSF